MKSSQCKLVCTALGVLLLATGNTHAGFSIYTDLDASGSVNLSTSIGVSPFSDGNVTQTGSIRKTAGGAMTSNPFSTAPGTANGIDDGTTTLPVTNPLTDTLTIIDDGVGFSTNLDALFETGFNFNEGYDFIMEFGAELENTSVASVFTVTMKATYSNVADAGGSDAFADSGLDLEVDNVDVLTSDVASDSLLGDNLNGVNLGTFGATVSDIGMLTFDVILNPGDTKLVGGTHQWEGGVFDNPGSSNVDISFDLNIVGVSCTSAAGGGCNVVPVPGAAWLFASGLTGLALIRRRYPRNTGVAG